MKKEVVIEKVKEMIKVLKQKIQVVKGSIKTILHTYLKKVKKFSIMKKGVIIKKSKEMGKVIKCNAKTGTIAFLNEVKKFWKEKGRSFTMAWIKNMPNDKIIGVAFVVEVIALIIIVVNGGFFNVKLIEMAIIQSPTFILLIISMLRFYLTGTKIYRNISKHFR